jgi:two-component system LytT family response regulator
MTPLRTVIVDDEPLARQRLRRMLAKEPDIEILDECGDGRTAVEVIRARSPNVLFLDVQMPEHNGFEVLAELGSGVPEAVIFTTAYEEYALKAFEVHALDYLLKPFDQDRLANALRRVRDRIGRDREELRSRLEAALKDLAHGHRPTFQERLLVRYLGRIHFVKVEEIDWIEAAGNYLKLHVGPAEHLVRETMQSMESQLDPRFFLRIHRSTMVNIDRIKELQPLFHGDYVVVLKSGRKLSMSRGYRDKVEARLGPLI